jgi:hypothetical protein
MNKRNCLECLQLLNGRKDQKFCSDYCRNVYNNRLNEDATNEMRKINRILRKNRKILEAFHQNGKTSVSVYNLSEQGFNFHYFTNVYKTQKGTNYYFCYDQGYTKLAGDKYILVRKKDYVS